MSTQGSIISKDPNSHKSYNLFFHINGIVFKQYIIAIHIEMWKDGTFLSGIMTRILSRCVGLGGDPHDYVDWLRLVYE